MPTGYTAYIENGEITNGKDFLLKCARGFGACVDLKEESLDTDIPVKLEPPTYHKEQLEKASADLEKYKAMTNDEAQKIVDEQYEKMQIEAQKSLEEYREKQNRYNKIKKEVEDWRVPTDGHGNLKKFALDQISISTKYDREEHYIEELNRPKKTAEQYISDRIANVTDSVQYHSNNWNEEVKRTEEINKWINDLRESL